MAVVEPRCGCDCCTYTGRPTKQVPVAQETSPWTYQHHLSLLVEPHAPTCVCHAKLCNLDIARAPPRADSKNAEIPIEILLLLLRHCLRTLGIKILSKFPAFGLLVDRVNVLLPLPRELFDLPDLSAFVRLEFVPRVLVPQFPHLLRSYCASEYSLWAKPHSSSNTGGALTQEHVPAVEHAGEA